MINQKIKCIGVLVIVLLLMNCVVFTPSLTNVTNFTANQSIIYGRFLKITGNNKIGIVVKNMDTSAEIIIELEKKSNITLKSFSVKPGNYKIVKLIFAYAVGNEIDGTKDIPDNNPISNIFSVEKGEAVYIGDWTGSSGGSGYTTDRSYRIDNIEDNFEKTTDELNNIIPFKSVLSIKRAFNSLNVFH